MDKNELKNIPLRPFMAVAMAPVVVFALANVMFLPLVEAFFNFSNGSFLADLVASTYNPFIQDFILIIAGMCCLPLLAAAVLIGPALTSFMMNLKYPVLTNRPRAVLSGIVFLFFDALFLIILFIFRFMENLPSIYSSYLSLSTMKPSIFTPFMFLSFLDPLPCLGFLAGIMLSCSVAVAGRFGAQKGSMRLKRTGSV
jgi:hypothetical protein